MADIRINALPNEPTPNGTDVLPIDGATTRKTSINAAVAAGGTPLFVPLTRTISAGAGLTGGGDLTANRTLDVNFTQVQPFSTKLTNLDGTSLSAGGMLFGAGVDTWSVLPAGVPGQFLQNVAGNPTWTNAAAGGDVVGPASALDDAIATYNGTTGKIIRAGNPLMADLLSALRGPMPTTANNVADATNDIDFTAGSCFSTDATHWPMVASTGMTKRLDATWVVGTNQGGRFTAAALANVTYFCYQIRNPTTGAVDFGFDTSPTAPTLPAGFTQYRMIAPILREGAAIVPYVQDMDTFTRNVAVSNRSSTAAVTNLALTLSVPIGIVTQPLVNVALVAAASCACTINLGSAAGPANANVLVHSINTGISGQAGSNIVPPPMFSTNLSGQIIFTQINTVGTPAASTLSTNGWVWNRGR